MFLGVILHLIFGFVVGGGCQGTFGVELVGSFGNNFLILFLSGGVALFLHVWSLLLFSTLRTM